MATTHDMRYEGARPSAWSWILPLALIVLAAIALASYLGSRPTTTTDTSTLGTGNTTPTSGYVTQ